MTDNDYDPYLDAVEDRAAFELERDTAWERTVEDREADRFEYLAGFATITPSYVFVEQPDGGFTVHARTRMVCQNQLLPFDAEVK